MNNRVVALFVATAIVVAIMLLFPPWQKVVTQGEHATLTHEGYHWIGGSMRSAGMIDRKSLLWMIGVVCAVASLAYLELHDGHRHRRGANS